MQRESRFPGQYYDQESGLHYNLTRDYNPLTGRYMQSDSIGLDGGINTYLYALANPIRYYDPDGAMPCDPNDTDFNDCRNRRRGPDGRGSFPRGPYGGSCGTGASASDIPDGFGSADFTPACNAHDECYGTCGKSKQSCDDQFKKDLNKACGGSFACKAAAAGYHSAVAYSSTAQTAYNNAQTQANCCE